MTVRARLALAAAAIFILPAGTLLLLLVPDRSRAAGDPAVVALALLVFAGCLIASTFALSGVVSGAGRESFQVDETGLHVRRGRRGDRDIPWGDLLELGWADGGQDAHSGLAGRLRTGNRYEPGGPAIAGWLARPALRALPPHLLAELRRRCEQNGVVWRDYAPAEIM